MSVVARLLVTQQRKATCHDLVFRQRSNAGQEAATCRHRIGRVESFQSAGNIAHKRSQVHRSLKTEMLSNMASTIVGRSIDLADPYNLNPAARAPVYAVISTIVCTGESWGTTVTGFAIPSRMGPTAVAPPNAAIRR